MMRLFRRARKVRRYAEDELSFRRRHAVYRRVDLELEQRIRRADLLGPQNDLFARPNAPKKLHRSNGGQQKKRPGRFGITGCCRNSRGLGQRLGQDHTGNDRVTREMPREHGIARVEPSRRLHRNARVTGDNFSNENKRRPMRKAMEVISDQ